VIYKNGYEAIDNEKLLKWQTNGLGIINSIMSSYTKNSVKLNEIIFDIGYEDWNVYIDGITYTSKLLSNNKILHRTILYEGDHGNRLRERIEKYMLPYFSGVLEEKL